MSKYELFLVRNFPVFGLNTEIYVFSPNTGKYGPEITPYLDTFHAMKAMLQFRVLAFLCDVRGNN